MVSSGQNQKPMKNLLLALACLITPTLTRAQDALSFATIPCDNVTASDYICLQPDMVSTKIVPFWMGSGTRTLKTYLNGAEIASQILSTSGDTVWANIPDIPLIPWSPGIGFALYNGSVMSAPGISVPPPIVWRNGVDTILMEVDEAATNTTTLAITTHIDDFEEPYAPGGRGCPEHHLIMVYRVVSGEGDLLAMHVVDVSAGESLDYTYVHEGSPTQVCVTVQLHHSDAGAGLANFDTWILPVSYQTESICWMMGEISTGELEVVGTTDRMLVYPNPCTEEVFLKLSGGETFTVFAVDGRIITSGTGSSNHRIDVSAWSPGVYHVRTAGGGSCTLVRQ